MINANELRLGNWFYHTNTFCHPHMQLIPADFKNELTADNFPQFDPISLTEEILLACNIRKWIDDKWRMKDYESFYLYKGVGFYSPNVLPEIKYLHQLQNLFFAITGKELIYSPQ